MRIQNVVFALSALLLCYVAYRGISCSLKSDETRVREIVGEFTQAFRDGDRGTILSLVSQDFEVIWGRRSFSRRDMADHLAFRFLRGERLVLEGEVRECVVNGDAAQVVWKGSAFWKRRSGTRLRRIPRTGSGTLFFRKTGGSWLVERVVAEEAAPETGTAR
jgi:hypothetical protein